MNTATGWEWNMFVGPRRHIKSANDPHTKGWNDAIERVCEDHDMLDYGDLCRLSRVFNQTANLADPQDYRINEALKRRIAAECPSSHRALSPSPERQETGETSSECFLNRSSVRAILCGVADEYVHITETLLADIDRLPISTATDLASPPRAEPSPKDAELIGRLAEMLRKSRKTIANICSSAGVLIDDSKFVVEIEGALRDAASRLSSLSAQGEKGQVYKIDYDGFEGTEIGSYVTREGKPGVVLQQVGTKVVHVYGRNRLPAAPKGEK